MALAAVIHHFIFSRRDFKSGALPTESRLPPAVAFLSAMPHDVVAEGKRVGGEVAQSLKEGLVMVGKNVDAAVAKMGRRGSSGGQKGAQEAAVVEWHATPLRAASVAAGAAQDPAAAAPPSGDDDDDGAGGGSV